MRTCLVACALAVLSGLVGAVFLASLAWVTHLRLRHDVLVWGMPVAGAAMSAIYTRYGGAAQGGTRAALDAIGHARAPDLPRRMAPMVFVGTSLSHLVGASVGREGTAVQMGVSMASSLAKRMHSGLERQVCLACGAAAGFGAVFGTPLAGAVFACTWLPRVLWLRAGLPVILAAWGADMTARAAGATHVRDTIISVPALSWGMLGALCAFALLVALTSLVFVQCTHLLKRQMTRHLPGSAWRAACAGAAMVLAWRLCGHQDFLGLGTEVITRAFSDVSLPPWYFAAKLGLTAVAIAGGFVGGEVTPLFFVGATLGQAAAPWLHLPMGLAAGVGMVTVFGAAAGTPLALAVMAAELFGPAMFGPALLVGALAHGLLHLVSAPRLYGDVVEVLP